MSEAWNAIPAEQFYGVRAKVNKNGQGRLFVVQSGQIPEDFALLFGEMLYQLRSALDACINQAAIHATGQNPPPDEKHYEFPITSNKDEFPKLAGRRMRNLPQDLQDAVERIQPYNQPALPADQIVRNMNRSLAILNDLARKDRHRKLHVVGSIPVKLDPEFILPKGVSVRSITLSDPGVLRDDADLAIFQLGDIPARWSQDRDGRSSNKSISCHASRS